MELDLGHLLDWESILGILLGYWRNLSLRPKMSQSSYSEHFKIGKCLNLPWNLKQEKNINRGWRFFFVFFISLFRVKIEISPNTGIIELLFKRNSVLVIVLQQLHD